jgi:hypothetical protein
MLWCRLFNFFEMLFKYYRVYSFFVHIMGGWLVSQVCSLAQMDEGAAAVSERAVLALELVSATQTAMRDIALHLKVVFTSLLKCVSQRHADGQMVRWS